VDLNNPKIEFVTSTVFERRNKGTCLDLSFFLKNDIQMEEIPKYLGTTIVSTNDKKTSTIGEDLFDIFTDDYDVIVKLPASKTILKKIHITSISKFNPKIVI
jgi:hypothetical protein